MHFPIDRRLVTATLLALMVAVLAPQGVVQARTQDANLIAFLPLASSTVAERPTGQRGELLLANDGNFYIVSSAGGKGGGAIAKIAPNGTLTVLHAFANGDEGTSSYARMLQASDGDLYGTTYLGGTNGRGVAFRITLSGTYTVLRSFGQNDQDASLPYGGLVQAADGNFYGTTLRGGNNDRGTVFKLTSAGTLTIIHHFDGGNGENPESTLIVGTDGNLYGTTLQGGADNRGTLFRISTAGSLTSLYSFHGLSKFNAAGLATNDTGANPRAGLLLAADGNFYGTAYQGGPNGYGTVFRLTPTGTVSVVHAFTGPSYGGGFPLAGVAQDAAGNLYGTTERGGYINQGSVWRIDTAGQFSVLHGFTGTANDGNRPYATLLATASGLYGASFSDQVGGAGAVFKLDTGSNGTLPVEFSVSPTEINVGSNATLTWSSPTAATCTASGAWNPTITPSGTQAVTPTAAGIYTYVLSCTDGGGVVRHAYSALSVKSPPAKPVDGGGGGGTASIVSLLLLGALASRRLIREKMATCP
jgi:uncharacterized repeat protein (TIGR03803 family)